MLKALRVLSSQGNQFIPDLVAAVPTGFRGLPIIDSTACASNCAACVDVCPTHAIALHPVRLDLGRCVFCTDCVLACPEKKIEFTSDVGMSAVRRELLVVSADASPKPVETSETLRRMFGRSLKLRQVSAGGCNACELELNALGNVNFDLQRFGIEWVASPRHADGLVLSGPLTHAMASAVEASWRAMAEPRFVVSFGACAISGGLYAASQVVDRGFLERIGPALHVPGCPPHPLTFVRGILQLLGIR